MQKQTTLKFPKNYYNVDLCRLIFNDLLGIPTGNFETKDIQEFISENPDKRDIVKYNNGIISIVAESNETEEFKEIIMTLDEMKIPYDLEQLNDRVFHRPTGTKELLSSNYKTAKWIDIECVKAIAEKNEIMFHGDGCDSSNCKTFNYLDMAIHNPFMDETGRFDVEPFEYYGEDNILKFITK